MKLLLVMLVVMVTHGAEGAECPAPYAEYKNSGRCFYSHIFETSYADASSFCQSKGSGHVVRIKTLQDESIVAGFQDDPLQFIWIGLKDHSATGTFTFTDGTPLGTHKPWQNTPTLDPIKACVTRWDEGAADYKWAATSCEFFAGFVCETSIVEPPCNSPWKHNPDELTCVRAIRGKKRTYTQAHAYCMGLGGGLAGSVTTLTERKRLMKLMKFQGHFFVGVDDEDNDGTYVYINDGSPVGPQAPFRKGKKPSGRCVTLKRRLWYPKSCTRRQFFICEKPDNSTP